MTDERPSGTWSYQSGAWFGVFGPRTTLLLPDSEKSRVAGLWALIDDGAALSEVVDGLVASGLSALPGFVLVGVDGAEGADAAALTVLLRGAGVRVVLETAGDPVELDGTAATTWTERRVEGVTSLTVTTGDDAAAAEGDTAGSAHFPIDGGLVRVSRVDRPGRTVAVAAEPSPAPPVAGIEPEPEPEPEPEVDAEPEPQPEQSAPEPEAPDGPAELATEAFDPLADAPTPAPSPLTPPPSAPPSAPLSEPPSEPPSGAPAAPLTPSTPPPPPPPLAPPAPPAPVPPAPDDDPDHDGMTQIGLDAGEFSRQQPGIPGQPQAPSVTRPVARLVISGGDTVDVDRVVLIGRAPEARRFTSTDQPRLVTVPSPLHEISSTHVEVRPGSGADHGSAVVTDMGSTNGTVLVQPGLGPEDLTPGIAVQLIPGAVINLGDGVTIQVTRP